MAESRQPSVYASIITTLLPAVLALALRFYPRRVRQVTLWWDDYLAVFALLPALAYDATAIFLIHKGLGLHLDDLPVSIEEAQYYQLLVQEIQEHTYSLAIGAAQLSLIALFWRLFRSTTGGMITILIMAAFVVAWIIARLLVAVFQCYPPQYFWDKSIDGTCTVDPSKFFLVSVGTHLVIDVALMIFPARQINHLFLPLMQKAAIGVMFMFGVTICVASIMTMVVSVHYDSYAADIMWNCTPVVNWSAVEVHLSIIACCLPLLRPVMRDMGGWWGQNFSSAKGNTDHSSLRLGSVQGSDHPNKDSDSTRNLAILTKSNSERGHIYGSGDETETYVTSKGMCDDEDGRGNASGKNILVRYEVNLGFSDRQTR